MTRVRWLLATLVLLPGVAVALAGLGSGVTATVHGYDVGELAHVLLGETAAGTGSELGVPDRAASMSPRRFVYDDRLNVSRASARLDVVGSAPNTAAGLVDTAVYGAFGTPDTTGLNLAPVGFQGDYTDSFTGTIDMGARSYSTQLGRFLQPDSYSGDLTNPATLNRYSYANNDPVAFFDPDGHCAIRRFWNRKNGCLTRPADWTRGRLAGVKVAGARVGDYSSVLASRSTAKATANALSGALDGASRTITLGYGGTHVGPIFQGRGLDASYKVGAVGGSVAASLAIGGAVAKLGSAAAVELAGGAPGRLTTGLATGMANAAVAGLGKDATFQDVALAGAAGVVAGSLTRSALAPNTAAGRQLVVGGGRAADMPATAGISLNTNPAALPNVVGDIANAPFRSGSFSSVYFERVPFSSFTGRNIGALDESARLLRPGGQLLIQTGPAAPAAQIMGHLERLGFSNVWKTEPSYLEISATWGGL